MKDSRGAPIQRVLITGGAGFVGSHLARSLIGEGIATTIIDNFSSGFQANVPAGADLITGDVRDPVVVGSAVSGVDTIFHLAEFIPNYPGHVIRYSAGSPRDDLDVCVGGTINVLEEARKNDASFVLASTAAVYGSRNAPLKEDSSLEPDSAYGAAKLCAETYSLLYAKTYGLPITIFRFFNLFGPRQRKYVMYDCLVKLKRSPSKIELLGTGAEVRDYISVTDAVNQLLSLIPHSGKEASPIFNLGSGVGRSTGEVVRALSGRLGLSPEIVVLGNSWAGNSNSLVADVSKARQYVPDSTYSFGASLDELVAWFSTEPPET